MSQVTIHIPAPLRFYTDGSDQVRVQGSTVGEVLAALNAIHPGIRDRILTPAGEPRQFVNFYLGSQNVRMLQGLLTTVKDGDVLSIIPAVAGG